MAIEPEQRKDTEIPLACFGLELNESDAVCIGCAHFEACKTATGSRSQHVPVTKATFTLQPPGGDGTASPQPDAAALYQLAHEQIFRSRARDTLLSGDALTVSRSARDLNVSLEVYLYACLLGHQVSCPERAFRAKFLLGTTAAKRVQFYRDRAVTRFHALDLTSIGNLAGRDLGLQREALLNSEALFGAWVVSERCRRGGNGVAALYAARECALHPAWLAIEPTYAKWRKTQPEQPYLKSDDRGAPIFNEIGRHRHAIHQVNPSQWPGLTRLRNEILPTVAAQILQKHQVNPSHVLTASPVTNAFAFWLRLGDALLQLRLLQIVHHEI